MDKNLYAKISDYVDSKRNSIVEDIKRIVRIESVSKDSDAVAPFGQGCRDVLDEMLKLGAENGFETQNHEYYCGSMHLNKMNGDIEQGIGIWCHLDVVPASDGWVYKPYDPTEKDGYLIGRGVSDNKGPSVAAMYALLCLKNLGVELRHPVRLFYGCNEEAGMKDMEYYTKKYPLPKLSITPDTSFPVCYAEKGMLIQSFYSDYPVSDDILELAGGTVSNIVPDNAFIKIRKSDKALKAIENLPPRLKAEIREDCIIISAQGISRHTAAPYGGVNAIWALTTGLVGTNILCESDEHAMCFMSAINTGFNGRGLGIECEDDISGALTCVGSIIDIENGKFKLQFNIRYPVTAKEEELLTSMHNMAAAHRFTSLNEKSSGPNNFPKNHPAVALLTNIYNELTGDNAVPYTMGGGTYARKLPNAFAYGMEMQNEKAPDFLPENHGQVHGPDEVLRIDSLLNGIKIFCAALIELDKLAL